MIDARDAILIIEELPHGLHAPLKIGYLLRPSDHLRPLWPRLILLPIETSC